MAKRGIGEDQIRKAKLSKQKILYFLRDGQWHRYSEILKAIKVSPTTLTKHLKELEKGIVERHINIESGEYPPPVSYRLKPSVSQIAKIWHDAIVGPLKRADFVKGKSKADNVNFFMEYLNLQTGFQLLGNLRDYFYLNENEIAFNQSLDLYVLAFYREGAFMLKEKLKELAAQGVNVLALIHEAEQKMSKHFEHLEKER